MHFSFCSNSVTASHDGSIAVWDNCKYNLLRVIKVHEGAINCLVYDQYRIITAGSDKWVFFFFCFYVVEFSITINACMKLPSFKVCFFVILNLKKSSQMGCLVEKKTVVLKFDVFHHCKKSIHLYGCFKISNSFYLLFLYLE